MDEMNNNPMPMPGGDEPGKGKAIGSLVCGIISVALSFVLVLGFFTPLIGLVLGIVGLVLASGAKKEGAIGGMVTGGFVLSIIGVVLCGISFIACVICAGALASIGAL